MMSARPQLFTAVLFGLSGCLVDHGAYVVRQARQPLQAPRVSLGNLALSSRLERAARVQDWQAQADLREQALARAQPTPNALATLETLHRQGVPGAWREELPETVCQPLASRLRGWLAGFPGTETRPWPAPDACWEALSQLNIPHLEGSVLVCSDTRLLEAGLRAGLWTIGLATSGSQCGLSLSDWQSLTPLEQKSLRTVATLELYQLGAHSVIDDLGDLASCLADLAKRRAKGEKP